MKAMRDRPADTEDGELSAAQEPALPDTTPLKRARRPETTSAWSELSGHILRMIASRAGITWLDPDRPAIIRRAGFADVLSLRVCCSSYLGALSLSYIGGLAGFEPKRGTPLYKAVDKTPTDYRIGLRAPFDGKGSVGRGDCSISAVLSRCPLPPYFPSGDIADILRAMAGSRYVSKSLRGDILEATLIHKQYGAFSDIAPRLGVRCASSGPNSSPQSARTCSARYAVPFHMLQAVFAKDAELFQCTWRTCVYSGRGRGLVAAEAVLRICANQKDIGDFEFASRLLLPVIELVCDWYDLLAQVACGGTMDMIRLIWKAGKFTADRAKRKCPTILLRMAQAGNLGAVESFYTEMCLPKSMLLPDQNAVLMIATKNGDAALVRFILAIVPLDSLGLRLPAFINAACGCGNPEIVNQFLCSFPGRTMDDICGSHALSAKMFKRAIKADSLATCILLQESKFPFPLAEPVLRAAVRAGNYAFVWFLLEWADKRGFDIRKMAHFTIARAHREVGIALIGKLVTGCHCRVFVEMAYKNGIRSVMSMSIFRGYWEIVRLIWAQSTPQQQELVCEWLASMDRGLVHCRTMLS